MTSNKKSFGKFMVLWSGQLIAAIGNGLTSFGLGVYVFEQTGKASVMALVTLLAFMPGLILSAGAGVLADRYDRRLLMVMGDALSALGLVFILVCMLNGEAQLWQICVGVTISSIFSSLLEPAYKATVTDMLTEEQYTKASGFVQIANSARYLISPIIAGFLLALSDIKLLIIIDILTLVITVISTLAVRSGIKSEKPQKTKSIKKEFQAGWQAISQNEGVLILVIVTSVMTFFMGFVQTIFTPMILAFSSSYTLGVSNTIAASGMLVTSLIIGIIPIKGNHVKILSTALFWAGIFMVIFGLRENIIIICASGFMFFAMLPFANTSLDFLVRTNIDNSLQGRAWGLIGVISQLGFVAAYAISGILADYVFTPLLIEGGKLASSLGNFFGVGTGRGTGLLISIAGLLLAATSVALYYIKSIKKLEKPTI